MFLSSIFLSRCLSFKHLCTLPLAASCLHDCSLSFKIYSTSSNTSQSPTFPPNHTGKSHPHPCRPGGQRSAAVVSQRSSCRSVALTSWRKFSRYSHASVWCHSRQQEVSSFTFTTLDVVLGLRWCVWTGASWLDEGMSSSTWPRTSTV